MGSKTIEGAATKEEGRKREEQHQEKSNNRKETSETETPFIAMWTSSDGWDDESFERRKLLR